jgi:hypothetical protein
MMEYKKVAIALLVGLISIVSLVNFSVATTVSMAVPAGEEINQKIDLAVDDRISIQFTVVGTENSFISFLLVYPNATEISFGEIAVLSYSFVCDAEGEYTMYFVNNDMAESKLVTLNYEIEHYMFGMPQLLFIALVIAVICIAMVAVYVLLSPPL